MISTCSLLSDLYCTACTHLDVAHVPVPICAHRLEEAPAHGTCFELVLEQEWETDGLTDVLPLDESIGGGLVVLAAAELFVTAD